MVKDWVTSNAGARGDCSLLHLVARAESVMTMKGSSGITAVGGPRTKPVSIGVVGAGGYAGVICDQLLAGMREYGTPVRLQHVCEPDAARHRRKIALLRTAGVNVFDRVEDLLSTDIDAVWLPLPIDLHREYTEMALRAGKAVMCEKPAAGSVQDVDAMIAARDRSGRAVAVGFQDLYDPLMLEVKRKILAGAIGRVRSASVWGCWPRDERYFQRSSWAGALQREGVWVLDSPANNAMAHYINLVLFLLGAEERTSVTPTSVEAELYRVNPIENYDTCSLRYDLPGDVPFLVLMTHACPESCGPTVEIVGERGRVRFVNQRQIEVTGDGRPRKVSSLEQLHANMQRGFASWVHGVERENAAVATLEMARCHTVAVNGASEASAVATVPSGFVTVSPVGDGKVLRSVKGIADVFATCAGRGEMLSECGLVKWAAKGGSKDLRGYNHFVGPKK
jgi:predicted dehydrogenase